MTTTIDDLARFQVKYDERGPDDCWPWRAGRFDTGYGKFKLHGRTIGSHRAALTLRGIEIPDGMIVLHACDNPPCVNPAHLRVGSSAENTADMHAKGRHWTTKGEQCPHAKLTESDVVEIRETYAAGGVTQRHLAIRFGVGQSTISHLINRKRWQHLGEVAS